MLAKLSLVLLWILITPPALAQQLRSCNSDQVKSAVQKYFENPGTIRDVVLENLLILALLEPSPVTAEKTSTAALGERKLSSDDYTCVIEYKKALAFKDAVLYAGRLNVVLTMTIRAKFNVQWYGAFVTATEEQRLESSIDVTKDNGEKLNAMGLNNEQERALAKDLEPTPPDQRAEFWKHPFGTAEENAEILRGPGIGNDHR